MIAISKPSLTDLWRTRFGQRRRNRALRSLAAVGYLANGPVIEDLIEIEKLLLVVAHDDTRRNHAREPFSGHTIPLGPPGELVSWVGDSTEPHCRARVKREDHVDVGTLVSGR